MSLTPDARAALRLAGFSRRDFLKTSGALIVGFSAAGVASRIGVAPGRVFAQATRATDGQLDSWIAIGADGRVTAYTGKCELGQGMQTAQTQLIAEELSVPVARVTLVQCDTRMTPDQGTTSGSQSHPTNFNERNLAQAAATAREALVQLASSRLGVPAGQLTTADGVVSVKGDSSKRVSYGELVGGKRFDVPLNAGARRKPASDWTVLGTSVPRVDLPALVTAELEFVHNVHLSGMLYGTVVRPPEVGATLASVDERSIQDVAGVVKVVAKKNFVGVVAEKPWQAIQAANKLKATWTAGTGLPAQAGFYEYLRKQPSRDAFVVNSGDVEATLKDAATIVNGDLSPSVSDARLDGQLVRGRRRAGRQGDDLVADAVRLSDAQRLGDAARPAGRERARHLHERLGCYGINGADTVSYDAALLSQAVGKPVRVQLSRKDEMAWENYGFAYVIDQRAGLDATGTIVAWDYEGWSPSLGGRPGYDSPGNVVTGMLAGFQPASVAPRTPAPEPTGAFNNGSNTAPSYVAGRVGGRACGGTGTITSERVLSHTVRSPFFTGPLRSPSRLQNTFAHESFMDEIAARVKADPVAYRLRHLRDPRLREVVTAAAKAASWDPRPPRAGARRTGVATGRGMACVPYEGDNGYCAMVAEVEVDQSTGGVAVKHLFSSQDCGPISNPDGMKNQIEGGALQGMSRALGEEVTWDDQKVTSVDWRTYHSLPLGFDVPAIESVLINRTDVEATGAGETAITIVAAAVGNAIFDATGVRIREVPFTPERVKAALAARG